MPTGWNTKRESLWKQIIGASGSTAYCRELCEVLLREAPDFAPAWAAYGRILRAMPLHDQAEQAFSRAIELPSALNRAYVLCDVGETHRLRGDIATAERCFRDAQVADPNDAHAYIFLGAMLARIGRLAEAREVHERATRCTSGCIDEAYLNLGLVLRALGDYRAAVTCFRETLARDPKYRQATLALRDCTRAHRAIVNPPDPLKSPETSERMLWARIIRAWDWVAYRIGLSRQYLVLRPDSSPGWTALGCGLTDVSRLDEAREALTKAIALSDRMRPMHFEYMGDTYLHACDDAPAAEWYRKAIAADPVDTLGYLALGEMQAQRGRLFEAEVTFRRATRCETGDIDEAFYNLALVLRGLRRYDEAIECLEKSLRQAPTYSSAQSILADCRSASKLLNTTA